MTIHELNDASSIIYEEAGENANVILGCVIDNNLTDEVNITVIATGLNDDEYPAYFKREIDTIDVKEKKVDISTQTNTEKVEVKDNKENEQQDDNLLTFGNELEIPTFLRNRNS